MKLTHNHFLVKKKAALCGRQNNLQDLRKTDEIRVFPPERSLKSRTGWYRFQSHLGKKREGRRFAYVYEEH